MMSRDEAMRRARKLPAPVPGVELKARVEVACAYMQLHGLVKKSWRGDLLVLTLSPFGFDTTATST